MISSGSVVLSEIARHLTNDKRSFKACLNRLCRGLKSSYAGTSSLLSEYLRDAGVHTWKAYNVIALDLSEIVKPYGKKMEHICIVRDASEAKRGLRINAPGWWTVEIAATASNHRMLPLLRRAWSSKHPDFEGRDSEIVSAIKYVLDFVSPKGLWVKDRGFDSRKLFKSFETLLGRWLVRQRGDRCIYLTGDDEPIVTSDIATAIELRAVAKPLVGKMNRLVPISVRFGWCTVPLKPGGNAYTLIKAEHRTESNPMMLLTTERPRTARQCAKLVTAYYRCGGRAEHTLAAHSCISSLAKWRPKS